MFDMLRYTVHCVHRGLRKRKPMSSLPRGPCPILAARRHIGQCFLWQTKALCTAYRLRRPPRSLARRLVGFVDELHVQLPDLVHSC